VNARVGLNNRNRSAARTRSSRVPSRGPPGRRTTLRHGLGYVCFCPSTQKWAPKNAIGAIEPRCLGKEECTDEVIEKSTDFRGWHKTEVAVASVEDGIVDLYGVFSCGRLLNERADSPDMLAMGQDVILGASSLLDDRAPHPACRTGALV
jgi:hypothetical protein